MALQRGRGARIELTGAAVRRHTAAASRGLARRSRNEQFAAPQKSHQPPDEDHLLPKSASVLIAAFTALLGAELVLPSASLADSPKRASQDEVLLGSYRCGASPSEAFLSLEFNATGDVFREATDLFRSVAVPSTPAETCELHAAALLDSASSESCKVSPVEISSDETGQSRSFQFVCRARRPAIIGIVADVSAAFLTSSP